MDTYKEALAALGFSMAEIAGIAFVLVRMGVIPTCEHSRPRFVECYSVEDVEATERRWLKFMGEMGFGSDAIALAESAIFGEGKPGTA
jgi:hypothetical protein